MKKIISLALVIGGLALGIYGATVHVDNQSLVKIGDISISKKLEVEKTNNSRLNWVSATGGGLFLVGLVLLAVGGGKGS